MLPNKFKQDSVVRNLLLPLTVIFIVITALVAIILYMTHQKSVEEISIGTISNIQTELDKKIEQEVDLLLTLEKALTSNEQMLIALQQNNREKLLSLYKDYYIQLNARLNITHFYFHQANLINLLRLHQPQRFNDQIERLTALDAKSREKPSWGMELGILGTYTLRVVSPVFYQNEVIGFIELGIEIEDLIKSVIDHHVEHLDWAVTINKSELNPNLWREGMKIMGREDNWDSYRNFVWVSSSLEVIPKQWRMILQSSKPYEAIRNLPDYNNRNWQFSVLPLIDMTGENVGDLIAFIDISELKQQHSSDYWNILLPVIALMLSLLLVLFYSLRKVDERIFSHQEQLFDMAHTDSLTNLPNRQLLNDRLNHAMATINRKRAKIGVIFLDLDNFKNINDSYGHSAGDELLKAVAQRLSKTTRQEDTVVRQGGDEFVIIIENIDNHMVLSQIANHILEAIDKPFKLSQVEVSTSTSIGISVYPDDGDNAEVILRNADSAMYQAKEKGRNNYCYYSKQLTSTVLERITIETKLRQVLKTNQELYLCYQPQFELNSNKTIGFEALARWKTADGEFISPADFIPVAEQTGLIYQLGEWALMEACQQAKNWLDKGFNFSHISVNVSGVQLQRNSLVSYVKKVLAETGLPAQYLELEVTESALMHNMELSIKHLEEIKKMGVSISIDDFGTGYSSLAYLKKLPLQKIKIDRSFVDGIPGDGYDFSIVRAIISMAQGLDLEVIAEGVETEEQIKALVKLGCFVGQGFYHEKPQSADYIEKVFFTI